MTRVRIFALALVASLGACDRVDMAAVKAVEASGTGFSPLLGKAYRDRAVELEAAGEHGAAAHLGGKALRAAAGWIDAPARVGAGRQVHVADRLPMGRADDPDLRLPGQTRPVHPTATFEAEGLRVPSRALAELDRARLRLIRVLAHGARHDRPEEAAGAQVAFDCWVASESKGDSPAKACRSAFEAAIVSLEGASPGTIRFGQKDLERLPPCAGGRHEKHYAFFFESDLTAEQAEALDRALLEAEKRDICVERAP